MVGYNNFFCSMYIHLTWACYRDILTGTTLEIKQSKIQAFQNFKAREVCLSRNLCGKFSDLLIQSIYLLQQSTFKFKGAVF